VTSGSAGQPPVAARQLAADLYQALAGWDRARLTELLHADFEGHAAEGLPLGLGGTYHGPEAMISDLWGRIGRTFAGLRVVPADFRQLDDGRLMVTGRYYGTARAGGGQLDAEFVHLLTFRDGQVAGLTQLTDTARWAAALEGTGPADAAGGATADVSAETPAATVGLELTDGLATIRLNRARACNAIDARLVADLAAAVRRCAADPAIRALLICANGPAFTVGGDIAMFARTPPAELPAELRRLTTSYHDSLRILDALPIPVVAAVHGAVAGGGLGLMYVADIVLAAEGTKFTTGFAGLALSGDGGSSWFLPRLVGRRRAAELLLGQRVLDAAQAAEWGLVTRVVPAAGLQAEAEQTARQLAAGPTRALGEIRALLHASADTSLGDQLLRETEALARTAGSRDAAHAIESFMAKTPPEFRGW
jgi:2-(1,2-epoxy-1,2-dihydrophenyl)acetyl-CoA isomerase